MLPPPVIRGIPQAWSMNQAKLALVFKTDVKEKAQGLANEPWWLNEGNTHTHTPLPFSLPFISRAPPQIRAILDGMGPTVLLHAVTLGDVT